VTVFSTTQKKSLLTAIIAVVAFFYALRLFQMQVLEFEKFDAKSSSNSIKAIEQIPLRGVFYDRNMNLLVENTPAYTVRIFPAEYNTKANKFLEGVLGLDSGYIANQLYKNRIFSKFVPIKIQRGASFEAVGWIEENKENLPGVDYIIEMQRNYPSGVMGAHVFGYSKEISQKQLEQNSDGFYNPGDLIGYSGLERSYEEFIRGKKGFNYILVDSRRREIGKFKDGLRDVASIKGSDLVLGIDLNLQRVLEESMLGKVGAGVAIEPSTGEILALVSSPDFDLNQFSYVTSRDYLSDLLSDKRKPQFNRATSSKHPPGSTFKILCAIAGLESGVINENSTFFCGGGFTFGRFFKCHGAHGSINVVHAIEKSCNSFFYQLIFKIGLNRLADYAELFGLGKKTGVDIKEEVKGLIPRTSYYEKIYGKNWPQGILVSLGIGQGEIGATPLQLAHFTALVANNGKSFAPHFVRGFLDENKKLHSLKFREINTGVSQKTFDLVKEGMFLVVNGAGTATAIRMQEIKICGKTGTAQNPHGQDHAWFIGYAPADNPQIAVAVLVENVGFGGTHAAPIAKRMIETYLLKNKPELFKNKQDSLNPINKFRGFLEN